MALLKGIVCAASIGFIGVVSGLTLYPSSSTWSPASRLLDGIGPSAGHLRTLLTRTGLTPERLAAAGVDAEETTSVIGAAKERYATVATQVVATEVELAAAIKEHDRLHRLVVSGRSTEGDRTAFTQAGTRLAAARTARDTALNGFFITAVAPLPEGTRATLSQFRQHSWSGTLPVEFLVATKSDEQWLAVRDAIDSVTASRNLGEEPDSGDLQLLTQARSDSAVASAKSSLDQNLATVTAAWNQSTSSL